MRVADGSDHCPAMKGIETHIGFGVAFTNASGSDHCPAMKGIETAAGAPASRSSREKEATTAPQ